MNAVYDETPYPARLRDVLPVDLLELPRWVVWKYETRATSKGASKPTKVPYNARTGKQASSTDARTWGTFGHACTAYASGQYDGLGFVLGDGISGVDLDACRDPETGSIAAWGRAIVRDLDSYSEVSPSGTGVHILVRGDLPKGRRKRALPQYGEHCAVEMYDAGRFFTVTGDALDGAPATVAERQDQLAAVHAQIAADRAKDATSTARPSTPEPHADGASGAGALGDADVIARAMRARKTGAEFTRLWNGDTSEYGGDESRADWQLLCLLRFWTQGNAAQMDRLFRRSGLMREKWDEKHYADGATYGARSIENALSGEYDVYTPRTSTRRHSKRQDASAPALAPVAVDGDTGVQFEDFLLAYNADDNGNAEAMYALYGRDFLICPAYGWLKWTGKHWEAVPEAIVAQTAITVLKRRRIAGVLAQARGDRRGEAIVNATKADKQRVSGCLALFQSYVIEPDAETFDNCPDLLNCQNGVLDLRTGMLTPHDPAQRFTYCVPVDYDPCADMAEWSSFVFDAVGQSHETARYLQVCAGYSLTGHTREEKMFYIYGPTRAGKGTFSEVLLALLPRPLGTEVDFVSFTARRESDSQNFDLAELRPARLVFASESNRYQSLNPAKIKALTGGNVVRCAFKHKDLFSYRPQFKVWLVSNHKVNADADDEALWGRVQVITFPHSRLGSEDVTLKERMRSPEHLRGVLRWVVDGAREWYAQGRLSPPETIVEATRGHRETQDYIGQWIADCCALDTERWTPSGVLLQSYQDWCEANSVKPLRGIDFSETLVTRFNCTLERRGKAGTRGYRGIRLGLTPDDDTTQSAVSHQEPANIQDSHHYDRLTADGSDTRNGENSHTRKEMEKSPFQPSEPSAGVSRQPTKRTTNTTDKTPRARNTSGLQGGTGRAAADRGEREEWQP